MVSISLKALAHLKANDFALQCAASTSFRAI
jgi:hypothetical protein